MTLSSILANLIDNELSWREAELSHAKIQLQRSIGAGIEFRYAYRCFAALTYAHYEGFTKAILSQALDDIRLSTVKISCCVPLMRNISVAPVARKASFALSNEQFINAILQGAAYVDTLPLPDAEIISDCSNLDISNLRWAVSMIGLDPNLFIESKRSIGRLVNLRHKCAHGELLTFDQFKSEKDLASEMFSLQADITLFMHNISVCLIDHMSNDKYIELN